MIQKYTEIDSTVNLSKICWTFTGKTRTLFFQYFLLAKRYLFKILTNISRAKNTEKVGD